MLGYGVFAFKLFKNGEFLLQYAGELITKEQMEDVSYREEKKGCFLYLFSLAKKEMCYVKSFLFINYNFGERQ